MVEINIERKKKPVWPWILLLVIVALLVWAIYEYTNDRGTAETATLPTTGLPVTGAYLLNYTYQAVS